MTRTAVKRGRYQADYQALTQGAAASDPGWLRDLRGEAWARFESQGFPTARRGNERWKYTSVLPIARGDFRFPFSPSPADGSAALVPFGASGKQTWQDLVFVDGRLDLGLSSQSSIGASLRQAIADGAAGVEAHLGRYASVNGQGGSGEGEPDSFVALNTAFLDDGACVVLPDGYGEPVNLRVTYVTTRADQPVVTHPRTLILAGRNTQLTVVETFAGHPGAAYFTNAVCEVSLAEGAHVDHYRLLLESSDAYHVGVSRVRQDKDSTFSSSSFMLGTALARNDLEVLLDAPGAYCALNGLYLTAGSQHLDNMISIDHAQPHCTSRLNYKGILDGKSKAVFGGTVVVRPDAQKSDAQQTDKNLLLSEQAEVDSKPSLLIYADDVQCSHGATAGHIDADTLFYLRSRGLDLDTASRMLIHAFAMEIIDSVKPEPLREYLDSLFGEAIPKKSLPVGIGR